MAQPHLLLLGAGKSSTTLIQFLQGICSSRNWRGTVADIDLAIVEQKLLSYPALTPRSLNIEDTAARRQLIGDASVVISLLPPALQTVVGEDCLLLRKHFLSASYTDPGLQKLQSAITEADLLFLMEMGLDPGIDHMSAMQLIDQIHQEKGIVTGFASHCGGLVAPACDNNPWHYKFSWNPRNVVLAGKAGAVFKQNKQVCSVPYSELFQFHHPVTIKGLSELATYPNRDSLAYIPLYGLETADNFIRTTLRYPSFCAGWNLLIKLGCTEENNKIDTEGICIRDYFHQHLLASGMRETDLPAHLLPLLAQIGWNDGQPILRKQGSSADILQWILEQKWALAPGDRDMIVMLHEITYTREEKKYAVSAQLMVEGDDAAHTAMAKTVGLPLGIAAVLLLDGIIQLRGLQIPTHPSIYQPVLKALEAEGIRFSEHWEELA
jgi:saccharopine dehydrogenase-like NADP-dependent oxidoreductase